MGVNKHQLGELCQPRPRTRDALPAPFYPSWSKAAGELLIVGVGVMLGLLATEWVASRKAKSDVNDAQAALRRELAINFEAVNYRQQISPCVRRRVTELQNWIAEQRVGDRSPLPIQIGRPSSRVPLTSVWEVAKTGQVAAKMPIEDRLRFASIYDSLVLFDRMLISERDIWFTIGDFAGRSELAASELARLNGLVVRAAAFDEAITGNINQMKGRFHALRIQPAAQDLPMLSARKAICIPFARLGDKRV